MAKVPYGEGVPEVAPDTSVPDSYQRIQAKPEAFGGAIASGLEKGGAGLTQASGNLFDIAQFEGQINVDDQVNHWIKAKDTVLRGDPGKTTIGPDGKVIPDVGYMGLEGRAASDQREATLKALEESRLEGRKNLKSPREQLAYDQQTRRMYSIAENEISVHANGQWKNWAGGVNEKGALHSLNGYTNNLDNPEAMAHHASDYINFKVQQAQLKFGDDPDIKRETIDGAKRDLLEAQVYAVGVKEPARAIQILDKNKNIAGVKYDDMYNKLRGRAEHQEGIGVGDAAIATAAQTKIVVPAGITSGAIKGAILKQESGNRSDIGTSVDNAQGPGQIIPATWSQYARPGERIDNPDDNREVSGRIIDDYYRRYNGDAQRVAVAYFSGPGNVAPAGSPTPWLNDRRDGNGKSVSAYVGDVAKKLGGTASLKADAYKLVMQNTDINPVVQQHALQRIRQVATDAQIAADATEKQRKQANDQAADGYMTRMLKGDFGGVAEAITNDNALEWRTKKALHDIALQKSGDDVDGATAAYGPGFWTAYKAVTAPAGDPSRISDTTSLLQMGGPDVPPEKRITLAGIQKLTQAMQQNQKSVPEHALNTSKVSLLNYAKTKLSFQEDTGPIKIRDPKGEALFHAKFIPKFEAGYDAWVKAGNDPWQFLTQENIDKLANGLRSKAEMARDRMNALGEATGEKGADTMPPAPEGIDKTVWNTVLAHPPVMSTGQVATHAQYGKAITTLKDNPTPEMMAKFDKWFGTDKVKAKDVLGTLGGKPTEVPKSEDEAAAYARLPAAPNYSIHDTKGPGPAGYLGEALKGIVPQKVQDYVAGKGANQ